MPSDVIYTRDERGRKLRARQAALVVPGDDRERELTGSVTDI